jgi:hypothetical protein
MAKALKNHFWSWLVVGLFALAGVAGAEFRSDVSDRSFRDDLSGVYHCDGGSYKGITIIRKSGDAYQLLWTIGPDTHFGVAIQEGDLLSSSWSAGAETPGIVVYKIQKDGTLVGKYTPYPEGSLGTETLTYQGPVK